jgi:hypothetical protein
MVRKWKKKLSPNLARLCLETKKGYQKSQNSESVLSSSPGEAGFCSSQTKHKRRTAPGQTLFVSTRLQENGHNPEKNESWVRVPVKIVYLAL